MYINIGSISCLLGLPTLIIWQFERHVMCKHPDVQTQDDWREEVVFVYIWSYNMQEDICGQINLFVP